MSNTHDTATILASLSALKQNTNTSITDEEIAGFLDKQLSPKDEQKVIDALAVNPTLLTEVVETYETKKLYEKQMSAIMDRKAQATNTSPTPPSLIEKISNWLSKNWLPSSSMGGLVAAAFAYVLLVPSLNLNDISQSVNQGYDLVSIEESALPKSFSSKGLNFNKSNDQIDFEIGQSIALSKLSGETSKVQKRVCKTTEECDRALAFELLGQWQTTSEAQCNSSYSASNNFWNSQAKSYNNLKSYIDKYNITLPTIDESTEQAICDVALNTKWRF